MFVAVEVRLLIIIKIIEIQQFEHPLYVSFTSTQYKQRPQSRQIQNISSYQVISQ